MAHQIAPVIAIYGAGQLGSSVAQILRERQSYDVRGPFRRDQAATALDSGADLVIIATTSRFRDVAEDIERAVRAGSNVLVSAEECANPWLTDPKLAGQIHALAQEEGVTVLGAGLNPGLIFDALVLTMLGAIPVGVEIEVTRVVDIGFFGPSVLRRLGIGVDEETFRHEVASGEILGHAGFPQSMSIVARGIDLTIERITEQIDPVMGMEDLTLPNGTSIPRNKSVGVIQTYRAQVKDTNWFTAVFQGHVRPDIAGWNPRDTIAFWRDGILERQLTISPGLPSQSGSQSMIANSVERILSAQSGWLTVADLAPAFGSYN